HAARRRPRSVSDGFVPRRSRFEAYVAVLRTLDRRFARSRPAAADPSHTAVKTIRAIPTKAPAGIPRAALQDREPAAERWVAPHTPCHRARAATRMCPGTAQPVCSFEEDR